jgi:allophanate hydrolase
MNNDFKLARLRAAYADGGATVAATVDAVLARIDAVDRPEVWIARVDDAGLRARAAELDALLAAEGPAVLERLPLFGVPFAVKDNIDAAGLPTTAACPAYGYQPAAAAPGVERLLAAGAVLVGKTNLDQFATGLVGARSPYGVVRNAVDPDYVSGGSSSGSAVAVALGLVGFALGTDTAGSGRVPAGLNGIVGLKPTRGLLSTRGVVPACRTLDCVSVFATSVADSWAVTQVAAGYDADDPYSRRVVQQGVRRRGLRIAVPAELEFFGDMLAQEAFDATLARLADQPGVTVGRIDYTPFRDAAALLYQGPWVAERYAAVGAFIDAQPDSAHPVVAGIVKQGKNYDAAAAFAGQYRLAALRRQAEAGLADYDLLLVPTAPTFPRIAEVLAEPVRKNAELGYYTNFVNFFDMAALAVPGQVRADGLPAGVTLIGPAGSDRMLAAAAQQLLGGPDAVEPAPLAYDEPTVRLAVVGAHLEGQPLNWQLAERGARKLASTTTSPNYRLYALANTAPPKPGLVRVGAGEGEGAAIQVEVWELPLARFGEFVAEIPAPLGIGSLELLDGGTVKGFICEPAAILDADDISAFGGWRAYLASKRST